MQFGKPRIVLAGLWTSVCIVGPALSAIDQGFEVCVIADACGDVSAEAHDRAMDRMVQAGAQPMTALQYLLELQRDWARAETYDFTTGWMKNVSVGGAIRYQSDVVIGYEPIPGATASEVSFDLANPYKGPSETDFDLWVGYWRKLGDKITWQVQLNLRNAFNGNDLIPISTQPDGTAAGYRIKPPQTWTLTNTFKF